MKTAACPKAGRISALAPLATAGLLALVLVWSGYRTYQELDRQRVVLLQSRAAALAARLEALLPVRDSQWQNALLEEDPDLLEAVLLEPVPGDGLQALWEGRELFRTEFQSREIFRAYVPVHGAGAPRIVRLDLEASAADFLTQVARRHLAVAALVALTLVALTGFAQRVVSRQAILERERLELEHLAQLGRMSGVLAHEIRNPLGAMKGFLQLAQERAPSAGTLLGPALEQVERLERLVRDLLLYGRPPQPVWKPSSWGAIATSLATQAQASGRRLETVGDDFVFWSDPGLLEQALQNLTRNALESARDVRVEVSAREGDPVEIRVADNGPGLSDEVRSRLFEPYFTTKASGTGLGLVIARRLIESLGGRLDLANRKGGGVEAVVRLPRFPAEAARAQG
jgi:two-component system sensor histidine kinase HydH